MPSNWDRRFKLDPTKIRRSLRSRSRRRLVSFVLSPGMCWIRIHRRFISIRLRKINSNESTTVPSLLLSSLFSPAVLHSTVGDLSGEGAGVGATVSVFTSSSAPPNGVSANRGVSVVDPASDSNNGPSVDGGGGGGSSGGGEVGIVVVAAPRISSPVSSLEVSSMGVNGVVVKICFSSALGLPSPIISTPTSSSSFSSLPLSGNLSFNAINK